MTFITQLDNQSWREARFGGLFWHEPTASWVPLRKATDYVHEDGAIAAINDGRAPEDGVRIVSLILGPPDRDPADWWKRGD